MPQEVIDETARKYAEVYWIITDVSEFFRVVYHLPLLPAGVLCVCRNWDCSLKLRNSP